MKYVAIDIEAEGLDGVETINYRAKYGTIWMLAINDGKKVTVEHDCEGITKNNLGFFKKHKAMLEDPNICKVVHNGGYDATYIELVTGIKIRNMWDTQLVETVIVGLKLNKQQRAIPKLAKQFGVSLDLVLPRYGFKKPDKSIRENFIGRTPGIRFTKKEIDYAKGDVVDLLEIRKAQEYLLTRDNLLEVALLENAYLERVVAMQVRGIGCSENIWLKVAKQNTDKFQRLINRLPKGINWNSPAQVKAFFKDRKIHITSYDELDEVYLATKDPLLAKFLEAREMYKAATAYGKDWLIRDEKRNSQTIDADGRVRPSIEQIINTGRNAFSSPNLQQLPGEGSGNILHQMVMESIRGKKEMWRHREAFVPAKGNVFVIGDFSGQEIGVMAAAAEETLWIQAMLRGEDVHSLTASLVSSAQWSKEAKRGCTFPKKCKCPGHKELRKPAKINNFMLAYGGGAEKFGKSTGTEKLDAIKYVSAHKRVIPRLNKWLKARGEEALATGVAYSADPYRRRRVLSGSEDWHVRNQGKNTPIQAAGANMLKLACISIPQQYYIALVIHDEIILEVPKAQAKQAMKAMKQVMEKAADYITGIHGLIKVTPRIAMNIMKED